MTTNNPVPPNSDSEQPTHTDVHSPATAATPLPSLPYSSDATVTYNPDAAIAGFWRRFGAFVIDTLVLGLFGQALAWSAPAYWFRLGPNGRFVGIIVSLLYFGVLNSRIGKGQTIGKRIMGIAVRDTDNQPISLGRAMVRTLILVIPSYLNGWPIQATQSTALSVVINVIIYTVVAGIGSAVFFTMIFNRKSRQGLHDMLCKTYVLQLRKPVVLPLPQTSRTFWVVSGALAALSLVAIVGLNLFTASLLGSTGMLASIKPVYEALSQDPRFFSFQVQDQYVNQFGSQRSSQHVLRITGWYRGQIDRQESTRLINDLATVALRYLPNANEYDVLSVNITSSFDLGIATGNMSMGDTEDMATWRNRLKRPII